MQESQFMDLMACLSNLQDELRSMYSRAPKQEYRSLEVNEIITALAKAQLEFEGAEADKINPHYKSRYIDLNGIVAATRRALAKHGLTVTFQINTQDDSSMVMTTTLFHTSGQWLSCLSPLKPEKPGVQALGSAITYMKRYTYAAITGFVLGDDDDDGEEATQHEDLQERKYLTQDQVAKLEEAIVDNAELKQKILDAYAIKSFNNLYQDQFQKIMERIKK
jgi:hypothetical protein